MAANESKGMGLYSTAARHHFPDAMFNLGLCYETGLGCTKNIDQAKRWYTKVSYMIHHEQAEQHLKALEKDGMQNFVFTHVTFH